MNSRHVDFVARGIVAHVRVKVVVVAINEIVAVLHVGG